MAESLAWGRSVLECRGNSARRKDVELLLAHVLGRDPAWIFLNRDHPLAGNSLQKFEEFVFLCTSGTPVQYLVETTEFFGLEMKVGRGVYIPKQETELLIEEALAFLETPRRPDLTWGTSQLRAVVHEVGTGSGAIAISIAKHAPGADIAASDVSAFALSVAHANAKLNGVSEQIHFLRGDLQTPLPGVPDLVVANLPYISSDIDSQLPAEVRAQPRTSLFSRGSGLGHIKRLLEKLILRPGGRVMLEIGFDQANNVEALCADIPNLRYERTAKDLAGYDRIAVIAAT